MNWLSLLLSDFLFEAIKSEREGSTRHYLEAADALASSPVEFFHADNFSMKFAAPILLDAFRGGTTCGPEPYDRGGGRGSDDEVCKHHFFALTSSGDILFLRSLAVPFGSNNGRGSWGIMLTSKQYSHDVQRHREGW